MVGVITELAALHVSCALTIRAVADTAEGARSLALSILAPTVRTLRIVVTGILGAKTARNSRAPALGGAAVQKRA